MKFFDFIYGPSQHWGTALIEKAIQLIFTIVCVGTVTILQLKERYILVCQKKGKEGI